MIVKAIRFILRLAGILGVIVSLLWLFDEPGLVPLAAAGVAALVWFAAGRIGRPQVPEHLDEIVPERGAKAIVETLAARRREAPPPRKIELPVDDDEDSQATEMAGAVGVDALGVADGQSFMIEYSDAQGWESRRRITVLDIKAGEGVPPCLFAHCHERDARRHFRVDRIKTAIDYDGEIHEDVPAFLAETFGMDPKLAMPKVRAKFDPLVWQPDEQKWTAVMRICRPHAWLLATLSLSDGVMDDDEINIVTDHLRDLPPMDDIDLDDDEKSKLRGYVKRLRPREDQIAKAIDQMKQRDAFERKRLLEAALDVVKVDGQVHEAEARMLSDLADTLGSRDP